MSAAYPGIPTSLTVAGILGIITYLIVFNLNSLKSNLFWLLSFPKECLLKSMSNEKTSATETRILTEEQVQTSNEEQSQWARLAKGFEVFPQINSEGVPSNWWFLVYAFRLLLLVMKKCFRDILKLVSHSKEIKNADGPGNSQPVEGELVSSHKCIVHEHLLILYQNNTDIEKGSRPQKRAPNAEAGGG